jgi:uncharacterized membrane protein YphA (DoxX/SURF4 family)
MMPDGEHRMMDNHDNMEQHPDEFSDAETSASSLRRLLVASMFLRAGTGKQRATPGLAATQAFQCET